MRRLTIIDGYNVIHADPGLLHLQRRSLELARNTLITRLSSNPSLRNDDVTVVFDGTRGGSAYESVEHHGRIRVIYSRFGETADEVIKRLVNSAPGEVRVISNDNDLRSHAASRGGTAVRVAPRRPPRPPADDEDEDLPRRTNKKGPARRPKKRDRQREPYWHL
jgi:predicted RNA-binding protein with PIN domain